MLDLSEDKQDFYKTLYPAMPGKGLNNNLR